MIYDPLEGVLVLALFFSSLTTLLLVAVYMLPQLARKSDICEQLKELTRFNLHKVMLEDRIVVA